MQTGVGNYEKKDHLQDPGVRRPRRKWKNSIKLDLEEVTWGGGLVFLRIGTGGGLL